MKLVFAQYLASLRERNELDAILPDLLSELGMTVFSRPARGTKQHGVDVAAVGALPSGERTLFLISIKPGDLRRSSWDIGAQSLRTSLNQIMDVYIPKRIPTRYAGLPVVVVLCLGGDLHEDVKDDVNGYMERNTDDRIAFDLWNGDRLAELLLSGVLRENALPREAWQPHLRKALALVDEPEASFRHFSRFLSAIVENCKSSKRARLTAIRQAYLGLWTLYVWARDTDNIEAAYTSSERAMLLYWPLIKGHFSGKSTESRNLIQTMQRLITLHQTIAQDYINSYIRPRAKLPHGLASAVPSHSSLDINLKVFDVLGRIGCFGMWQLHTFRILETQGEIELAETVRDNLNETAALLVDVLENNPILCTPVKDDHAIDINIACLFLNKVGLDELIQSWIQQIVGATIFAFQANSDYPCIFDDYRDLADHPISDPEYRIEATAGSILVPTLAVWAALTGNAQTLSGLADFSTGPYSHSTLQLWYPGRDTEEHLYADTARHGLATTNIKIERLCSDMLAPIRMECSKATAFGSLSALQYGLWPLIISASRHYRYPVPPQFWPLDAERTEDAE